MLDIGLGQLTSKRGEDCVLVLASRTSTASNQGFKVELVKRNGRGNDVRKRKQNDSEAASSQQQSQQR